MSKKELPGTLPTNFTDVAYPRFEAAWLARQNDDPPPSWQDYLPAADAPCSPGLIRMLLQIDIEFRSKAGLPALLTQRYFEHPRLQQEDARLDAKQQMELIQWEYLQRLHRGERPRRAEYEAAFPPLVEALRQMKPLSRCPQCQNILVLDETMQTLFCPDCGCESSLAASAASPDAASPQLDLRGYELMESLGKGGMGEVYRCCDPALGRNLAIKVMKADLRGQAGVERRFLREARITGSLQHPNIVAVHNLGRLPDGRLHYTMRLVRGDTFAVLIKEAAGKLVRLPALLAIFQKVCEAVAYAHSKRVLHRDLKPVNVMVGKFGEVQVMDWGLAKLLNAKDKSADEEPRPEPEGTRIHAETANTPDDLTRAGYVIGTPEYMPPEQAQGDWELVDERADVFALGAILCAMLTGRPPYCGADGSELLRRARRGDLTETLARLEQCEADAALTALCRECLSVECRQRPRDAAVVARRLAEYQAAVEQRLRQAELERTEAEVKRRERRKRQRLALILSSAVLLVLSAGLLSSTLLALKYQEKAKIAEGLKGEAEENAEEAGRQKKIAEKAREDVEKALYAEYAHRIDWARREWQDGNVQHARVLLDDASLAYRGWEHGYLRHLFDETQQTFRGHSHAITSVYISPDGKHLASASQDRTVKVWDAATGKELHKLQGHSRKLRSVCFSADGRFLASGSDDETVRIWDAATGRFIRSLQGHRGGVTSVCISPDGKFLASGGEDNTVKVWHMSTGQIICTLRGHSQPVTSVCIRSDSRRLASGSRDKKVKVWDVDTRKELRTLEGHDDIVWSVCFHPDGKRLASASQDRRVKVWDVDTEKELRTLQGHTGPVTSVCFSADGERLVSGSQDNNVKMWDVTTGSELRTLRGHSEAVWSVCFSSDGQRVASGSDDKTVKVWDAAADQEVRILKGHGGPVWSVCISPDGKHLASASEDRTVKVWNADTGKVIRTLDKHAKPVNSVCFSPDGKRLASASHDTTVKLWDAASGELIRNPFQGHTSMVRCVCFRPDGRFLASGDRDGKVLVWDAASGEIIHTLTGHSKPVSSVGFSPDGKLLVSGGEDNNVKLWDVATGTEARPLAGHKELVTSVCFSPDGKHFASASQDRTVKVWDAATGDVRLVLEGHTGHVTSVCFSPDGKRLASGGNDQTVKVWDAATGQEVLNLKVPIGYFTSVCFSADGKRLIGGSGDNTVKVWDAATGKEALNPQGHTNPVTRRLGSAAAMIRR